MEFPVSLAEKVRRLARERPRDPAFIVDGRVLDWAGYDAAADRLARVFLALGLEPGERVAVWVPDGTPFHIAYQAAERCGLVCLGLAPRCGERELAHLLTLAVGADPGLGARDVRRPRGRPASPVCASAASGSSTI